MKKQNGTVRNHYIPQFFQKYFLNRKGKIWVIEKNKGKWKEIEERTPKGLFYKKHLYDQKTEDLSSKIENDLAPIIKKISNAHSSKELIQKLSSNLGIFLKLQDFIRLQHMRQEHKNKTSIYEVMKYYPKLALAYDYIFVNNQTNIPFIISDNFIHQMENDGKIQFYIPLSKNLCLFLLPSADSNQHGNYQIFYKDKDEEKVESCNLRQIQNANSYIASSQKKYLEKIRKRLNSSIIASRYSEKEI